MPEALADPLEGVRVIDCAEASGAYCGRLLADLGADVVLVEPPGGGSSRTHEPLVLTGDGPVGCFDRFVNLNKRAVTVPLGSPEGRDILLGLVAGADVLIDSRDGPGGPAHGLSDDALDRVNPRLVHVVITPFGEDGPYADERSDDLTTLAAGGLLSLGGYQDAGPVAVCGEQTYFARSIFGAAGAILALIEREGTGRGDTVEVCGQEAVANALEDAVPDCDLNGRVRRRRGERPREAGTGTYRCADGYVAIVAGRLGTAKAFASLVEWIVESGTEGAQELRDPRWTDHRHRQSPEGIERFGALFERFAATRTKSDLYEGAQRRSIALAPVNSPAEVLADVQLASRRFFQEVVDGERTLRYPGRPFAIDGLGPFLRHPVPAPGQHNAEVLAAAAGAAGPADLASSVVAVDGTAALVAVDGPAVTVDGGSAPQ
jgi:benzylsuccinate CoA-transferase BbsE subunit